MTSTTSILNCNLCQIYLCWHVLLLESVTFFKILCRSIQSCLPTYGFSKRSESCAWQWGFPFLSSTVSTVQACVNKCHNHPSCESLVYDKVSSQCSLFDGKDVGEEITSNQIYNRVANKTVHQNIIGNYRLRYLHFLSRLIVNSYQ